MFRAVIFVLLPIVCWAQNGAVLKVHVLDKNGVAIEGARVQLNVPDMDRLTMHSGAAEFAELSSGVVIISISHRDYAAQELTVELAAGSEILKEIVLQRVIELPPFEVETQARSSASHYFDRAELEQSSAATVAEFLMSQGVEIRTDGGSGASAVARVGGSSPNQVAVFRDGQRLNATASGVADLSQVSLHEVESIIVSRGAQPELTTEAIGGVVQLESRDLSQASRVEGSASWREDLSRYSVSRSEQLGQFTGSIEYAKAQGSGAFHYRYSADDAQGEFDTNLGREYTRVNNELNRDQFVVRLQSERNREWAMNARGEFSREERGMPGYIVPNLTPEAGQNSGLASGTVEVTRQTRSLLWSTRSDARHESREYSDPASPFTRYSTEVGRSHGMATDIQAPLVGFSVSGGVAYRSEKLSGTFVRGGAAQRERGELWSKLGRELRWKSNSAWRLKGNAAARYVQSGETDFLAPKVELIIERTGANTVGISASAGKSCRIPDLYSMFWLDDQFMSGNPELEPEVSRDFFGESWLEFGNVNRTKFAVNLGRQEVEQLIVWRPGFDGKWKPLNTPSARIKTLGVDFSQGILGNHMQFGAGADWTEARDSGDDRNTGGKYLTYRAPRTFRGSLTGLWKRWSGQLHYRYVEARPVTESNTKWLAAYRLCDVQVGYQLPLRAATMAFDAGISNVLNADYRIVRHAPMPLRQIYVGLQITSKGRTEK